MRCQCSFIVSRLLYSALLRMPLKNTLEKWDQAVKAFSEGQYEDCLRIYESTEEISARMYYNMACAYIKLQQESQAIQVSITFISTA